MNWFCKHDWEQTAAGVIAEKTRAEFFKQKVVWVMKCKKCKKVKKIVESYDVY